MAWFCTVDVAYQLYIATEFVSVAALVSDFSTIRMYTMPY